MHRILFINPFTPAELVSSIQNNGWKSPLEVFSVERVKLTTSDISTKNLYQAFRKLKISQINLPDRTLILSDGSGGQAHFGKHFICVLIRQARLPGNKTLFFLEKFELNLILESIQKLLLV